MQYLVFYLQVEQINCLNGWLQHDLANCIAAFLFLHQSKVLIPVGQLKRQSAAVFS